MTMLIKDKIIKFTHINEKGKPLKIWQNLDEILKANNIEVRYNQISRTTEITGVESEDFNNQIIDIHSLSMQYGLNLNTNLLLNFINRIGEENDYNPICDYLNHCYENYDNNKTYIQQLCDAIITESRFDKRIKEMIITKWLINTVMIPFNDGSYNTEGILTIQGKQGIGKTRLIRKLGSTQSKYIKTGIELDPSDRDKINQCTKYWIVELGELDATLKRDISKLKAFITESIDEYRMPYAMAPCRYPRRTSFYATVNNREFLKDETGNRRYWVLPVEKINFSIIDNIDIDKLWGEAMYLYRCGEEVPYLRPEELLIINSSNKEFNSLGHLQIAVENTFDWQTPKERWGWKKSSEIAGRLNIRSTKGLKETLEEKGGEYKKRNNVRGYHVPPYMGPTIEFDYI